MNKSFFYIAILLQLGTWQIQSSVLTPIEDSYIFTKYAKPRISIEEYIASYQDVAMELMKTYKMPASIILAQGIVESSRGNNSLAVESNNHFGILCEGTSESEECYKKYNNSEDSFSDHVKQIVQSPKYTKLFTKAKSNYIKWTYGLKKYGYATDKNYPKRLMYYIEKYRLYQFDDKVRNKKPRRGAKKDKFRKLSGAEQTAKVHEEQLELKQQAVVKDSVTNTLDIDKEKLIINVDAIKPEKETTVLDTGVAQKQELTTDDNSETAPQEEKVNDSVISNKSEKETTVLDTGVAQKQELTTDDNSETAPQEEKVNDSVISNKSEKETTVLDTGVAQKQELTTDDNVETTPQEEKTDDSVISGDTTKEENVEIVASTPRVVAVENTSPNIYESQYYIVQPKDTYYSIAKRYGISVRFLKELNSARSNLIIIGQSLIVVGDLPDYKIHHIVKDDTLYNIANRYGVTIAYLKTINDIGDDNLIYIGDELKY